jgi:DNA-binding NtrC family response regulator
MPRGRYRVRWRGSPAPPALRARLERAGVDIDRQLRDGSIATIVSTSSTSRVPSPPADAELPWIWLTAAALSDAQRVQAVRRGAYEALCRTDADAIEQLVARLEELAIALPEPSADRALALSSAAARSVVRQVARVAATSMSVLFTGETGTGKEVMARLTHAWSPRRGKLFVPINCAAIPNDLMEAELFGYARGAFSGAVQRYDGQLMAAEGGTVFLDEVDDTSLETQVKLLRVLEDRVVSRLGENVWHQVDFRLLAATNRDLAPLIEAGLFGQDLYERLAIVTIHLAPLRERLEDLPELAGHVMARFAQEQNRPAVIGIHPAALRALQAYRWPGNIRELRNVLYETLVYKRGGTELLLSDLPKRILAPAKSGSDLVTDRSAVARKIARGTMNLRAEVAALERLALEEALSRTGGNAAEAARVLGQVGRGLARDPGGTVRAMIRRLGSI